MHYLLRRSPQRKAKKCGKSQQEREPERHYYKVKIRTKKEANNARLIMPLDDQSRRKGARDQRIECALRLSSLPSLAVYATHRVTAGGGAAHGCCASALTVTHYFITMWHDFRPAVSNFRLVQNNAKWVR